MLLTQWPKFARTATALMACTLLLPAAAQKRTLPGVPQPSQQPASQPAQSETVVRATTRMVLLDVVAVDHAGHPVTDLKQQDFTLLEDGKPQKLASFTPHQYEFSTAKKLPPVLPPHVTTNRPEIIQPQGPGVVGVMLLDGLNTPPQKQVYVKQQMLKYLAEQYDPRVQLAVVMLTDKLTMLQDFTSNPVLLKGALDRYVGTLPALARATSDNNIDAVVDAASQHDIMPAAGGSGAPAGVSGSDPGVPGNAGGSNSTIADDIAYMMRRFEKESENFSTDVKVSTTLAALQNIARFMAAKNGRKILVWLSAGFPISVTGDQPEDMETSRSYGEEIKKTTNLLNDTHVAIYAINANPLIGSSVSDVANSGRDQNGRIQTGLSANRALATEVFARFSTEDTLARAAADTGGRYFGNRNDLDGALKASLQESSSYYMLGYYPTEKKFDARFRHIKLKVARDGVQLRYRTGYYATDPRDWRKGGHDNDLSTTLKATSLPATEVLFMARAVPPAHNVELQVEFLVDASTITFGSEPDNREDCNLNFEVQAFSPEGKLVKAEVQTAEAPLSPQTAARVRQQGLPMKVPIKLAAGRYLLHLGVRDNRTGWFGTAELPVEIPQ
jgi:VWFA-related protein